MKLLTELNVMCAHVIIVIVASFSFGSILSQITYFHKNERKRSEREKKTNIKLIWLGFLVNIVDSTRM